MTPAKKPAVRGLFVACTPRAPRTRRWSRPVSGLLFTNFGKGVRIFGFALAPIGGANEALSHLFKETHEAIAIVLITLVCVHALAALWHHFGRRDARPPACCRRARATDANRSRE